MVMVFFAAFIRTELLMRGMRLNREKLVVVQTAAAPGALCVRYKRIKGWFLGCRHPPTVATA